MGGEIELAICPHCGGMAVVEEFTRVKDVDSVRVTIRRCVSLGRDRSRRRKPKDPKLRSTRDCGEVEVLREEMLQRSA